MCNALNSPSLNSPMESHEFEESVLRINLVKAKHQLYRPAQARRALGG